MNYTGEHKTALLYLCTRVIRIFIVHAKWFFFLLGFSLISGGSVISQPESVC